jgi:hypothetical protein
VYYYDVRKKKATKMDISIEDYKYMRQREAYFQMLNLAQELRESASAAEVYRDSRQELEEKR